MLIKKQFGGYNINQVDEFFAVNEKQQENELMKLNTTINELHQKNLQQLARLSLSLQKLSDSQESGQKIIDIILDQVQRLNDIRKQSEQKVHAAQNELDTRLDGLTESYRIIKEIKNTLTASHRQLRQINFSDDQQNMQNF